MSIESESNNAAVSEEKKLDSGKEPSSTSWIKDISTAVGIVAAAVGVWISIADLRMKSETDFRAAEINLKTLGEKSDADRRTAEIGLKSEDVKLKIAEEQFRQHRQDSDDLRTKEQNTNIATAIDHIFDTNGHSEGNLAILFRYAQENTTSRDLIINAVVVRLGEPRSVGEIRLGLQLLRHIGRPALVGLVEVNRNVRRAYDDILFDRFQNSTLSGWRALDATKKHLTGDAAETVLLGLAMQASSEVTDRAHVPARYVRATLFRKGDHQIGLCEYMLEQEHQELGAPLVMERLGVDRVVSDEAENRSNEELLAYALIQSRLLIVELTSITVRSEMVDLSGTYLGDVTWQSAHYPPLRLNSAYISGDSFDGVVFSGKEASLAKADRIELRTGVITPSQQWPRFVQPDLEDWSERDSKLGRQLKSGKRHDD